MATDCWLFSMRLALYRTWHTAPADVHAYIYPLSQMARCPGCYLVVYRAACSRWQRARAALPVCPACRVSPVHVDAQRRHIHRPRPIAQEPVEHLLGSEYWIWMVCGRT